MVWLCARRGLHVRAQLTFLLFFLHTHWTRKPGENADDSEHPKPTEITSMRKIKNKIMVATKWASASGKFTAREYVTQAFEVLDDLKCLEEDEEVHDVNLNLMVEFVQNNHRQVTKSVAKHVASLHDLVFESAFPQYTKAPKAPKAPASGDDEEEEEEKQCEGDHKVFPTYTSLTGTHYFELDRKYSEASCAFCKFYFPTDANLEKGRKFKGKFRSTDQKTGSVKSLERELCLPSKVSKVYVCSCWNVDRTNCGNMICTVCAVDLQNVTVRGGRRRGAKK